MADTIEIRRADPAESGMKALLTAHLLHAAEAAPDESNHTLSPEELSGPGIRFWALEAGGVLTGCGALAALPDGTAEVKSVHVAESARGKGLAKVMMHHLEHEARKTGATALVLETGSALCPDYDAARALYESLGYQYCAPFGSYSEDPMSAFMTLPLSA